MFICGRQLQQVHVSKLDSFHLGIRRSTVRHTATRISSSRHDNIQRHGLQPLLSSQQAPRRPSPTDIFSLLHDTGKESKLVGKSSSGSATDLYAELRRQNPCSVSRRPAASCSRILEELNRKNSDGIIDTVCNDVVKDGERQCLLHSILKHVDLSELHVDTLVSVLDNTSGSANVSAVEKIIRFVADSKDQITCQPLVRQLHSSLLKRLLLYRSRSGTRSLAYHPPALVHAAFSFAFKLVTSSEDHLAMDLLRALCDRGFIPLEAVNNTSPTLNDPKAMVCVALIRASIHWNWRPLAVKMLLHLLQISEPGNLPVFDLAVDTSYALLDAPLNRDIRSCASLFQEMHRLTPLPSALLCQFYSSAAERSLGEEAQAFYSFSRTAKVTRQHQYPPPQGMALPWMMHHLGTASKKTHLSRALATEVVEQNIHVAPQSRARFITLTASLGYASLARKLWSRYSIGKDNHLITGNSALMLRMMSLFAHLIRQAELKCQQVRDDKEREALTSQLRDLAAFRDHVLQSYCRHYSSFMEAPHTVITSFARACFIVGKVTEGFKAFKVLLRRREIPDMYDVNVALSAIAQRSPRSAASIIDRMKQRGVQPDAVCYATVMHFAHVHNDSKIALRMMNHLCTLDRRHLSLKSVAALIRMTLAFKGDETMSLRRQKLQDAMDIIVKLTENKFLPSPQTGKYLVITSLRADDPVMAYRFWNMLLRESAEWNDREQIYQRHLISRMIRQRGLQWLKKGEAEQMLKRLKEPPNR